MNIGCFSERWLFISLSDYISLRYCKNLDEEFNRLLDLNEKGNVLLIDYLEFASNLNKSFIIVDLMLKSRIVDKVIFLSTYGVYKPQYRPYNEDSETDPRNKSGLYAMLGENVMRFFSSVYDNISIFILRLFNVYGPYQPTDYIISSILHQIAFSDHIKIGPLNRVRDFLFIEDLAEILNKIIKDKTSGLRVYNVGTGNAISIDELVRLCLKISGKEKEVIFDPSKLREEYDYDYVVADIERIVNDYSWKPQTPLHEGLKITYNWIVGGKGVYV